MNAKEKIIECLKKIRGEDFSHEDNLITDGWIDSFDMLKLVQELETAFNIEIDLSRIMPENFDSVESIKEVIDALNEKNSH